jgi:hypothetical protein
MSLIPPEVQSYPPPTELPAMRAGELDARYLDCGPALAPVGDLFTDLSTVAVMVTRLDGVAMSGTDLQPAGGAWPPTLDATGRIPTFGWIAPLGAAGVTYLLTLTCNPTNEGRVFVRDWIMSILPLLG